MPGSLNHDAKGNLTLDPDAPNYNGAAAGQKYEYDGENRLIRVRANDGSPGTVLFDISYDALGRRIGSLDHTGASDPCAGGSSPVSTRHVYSGIQTIEEYVYCDAGTPDVGWELAREFIWGPRFPEPVAMVDHTDAGDVPKTGSTGGSGGGGGGPEILHYLHDVLGSSIVLTNSDGAAVERYTYDPYGRTVIETYDASLNGGSGGWVVSGADGAGRSKYGNPFLWTGQRYDAGVLLYHFLFRSYSPSLGRWLARDPAGYVDGVNLVEYVRGRPLWFVDPLGLEGGFWGSIGRILVSAGSGAVGGAISGAISGTLSPPVNFPAGTVAGAGAGAVAGAVAGVVSQTVKEITSGGDSTVGEAAMNGLKNGLVAGVVPGAAAGAEAAQVAVSVTVTAGTEGAVTFVAVTIETEGDFGQAVVQAVVAIIGGGLGGGLTEAGDDVAAFLFGLDISIITNIVDELTGGDDCD